LIGFGCAVQFSRIKHSDKHCNKIILVCQLTLFWKK